MAGEVRKEYSGWTTLEANGASISNNSFIEADDAILEITNGDPHAEFELVTASSSVWGGTPTANTSLVLFAVDQDVGSGAIDARAASANKLRKPLAFLTVDASNTQDSWREEVFNVPRHARIFVQNAGTGQTLNSGWTLRYRPFCFKATP